MNSANTIKKGGYYLKDKNNPSKEFFIEDKYLEMVSKLKNQNFIVFDLETTALKPDINYGKIIEIGAVKIKDGEIIDRFSTFINPGMKIPKKIVELTHITDEMVSNSPDIWTSVRNFNDFIEDGYVLVAHNARFDVSFLAYWLSKMGLFYDADAYICTMVLDKILNPNAINHKLCTCIQKYGIVNNAAHRAVDDAEATAKLLIEQRNELVPYLESVNYTFKNEAKEVDMTNLKIRSYGDWVKPATKTHGIINRLYINLYYPKEQIYGTVYYDRITKSFANKDFPIGYTIDFDKLEEIIKTNRKEGLN